MLNPAKYAGRPEAGRILVDLLRPLATGATVVAAIPRGGVAVASPIAEQLGLPLIPIHSCRLVAPFAPEQSFGAIDEDGRALMSHGAIVALGLTQDLIEEAKSRATSEISCRRASYPVLPGRDQLSGRVVILVDDGLATGHTLQTALRHVQHRGARACIVAVPCATAGGAEATQALLGRPGDQFVCPAIHADLSAISDCYENFGVVSDEEVARLLGRANPSLGSEGKRRSGAA